MYLVSVFFQCSAILFCLAFCFFYAVIYCGIWYKNSACDFVVMVNVKLNFDKEEISGFLF